MNRSIDHNVYALLNKKVKYLKLFVVVFILFMYFIYLLITEKVPVIKEYQAIYTCKEDCYLSIVFKTEDISYLQKDLKLHIQNKEIPVLDITFDKESDFIEWQNIHLYVAEQKWYEGQTITFQLILKEESLGTKIFRALRGGEENAR